MHDARNGADPALRFSPTAGRLPAATCQALKEIPFLVTGPTGWLGLATLYWLRRELGAEAFARNVLAFGSTERELNVAGVRLDVQPLSGISPPDVEGRIIFHLAFLTRDKIGHISDQDYAKANLGIDEPLLAALSSGRARGVFVASSGAAGKIANGAGPVDLYGLLKLYQEERFQALAATGSPAFIGRIFNISGPFGNKFELYALASFIQQALRDGAVEIRAANPVYRSYVHAFDLIATVAGSLIATIAPAAPMDISGSEIVEMDKIATVVAQTLGLDEAMIRRPPLAFDSDNIYVGASCAFSTLAMRCGLKLRSFAQQVADTADFIQARTFLTPAG